MPSASNPLPHSLWLALVVGNTRLHWGLFEAQKLVAVRHTHHLVTVNDVQAMVGSGFDYLDRRRPQALWMASVVPEQTAICLRSPITCHAVERSHIQLANLYDTLGIDRIINLLGAKARVGWPVVVVDAGTALTFTAGYDLEKQVGEQTDAPNQISAAVHGAAIYGGAILPGIRLQAEALKAGTAALEAAAIRSQNAIEQSELPTRWANDTEGAIASGLIYGAIATLTDRLSDWWQRFPNGKAVLTGGDGPQLYRFLQQKTPAIAARVSLESELMFYGMSAYRQSITEDSMEGSIEGSTNRS